MPKQPPRNAFFFYMEKFKREQENRGVRFANGWRDVSVAASPSWSVCIKRKCLIVFDNEIAPPTNKILSICINICCALVTEND